MEPSLIVSLVTNFLSGFVMTWLRGYSWFGERVTYAVALFGGVLSTAMIGAHSGVGWLFGIMTYSLAVLGGVKVGGDLARSRAENTSLPAKLIPQFNEISGPPSDPADEAYVEDDSAPDPPATRGRGL